MAMKPFVGWLALSETRRLNEAVIYFVDTDTNGIIIGYLANPLNSWTP